MHISGGFWSMRPVHLGWLVAAGGVALAAGAAAMSRTARWDLSNRTVLLTGGSRGLGLLIARELVRKGARVAICGRDGDTLDRARAQLADRDDERVLALSCDVSVQENVESMIREVGERLGPIDALINNAGTVQVGPVELMDVEDFRNAMDVNFWGALHTIQAVLPGMRRRRRGRILNVASIGGKISVPHLVPYSVSKFALVGLSEGLRAELAAQGVEVITICPGLMRTGSPRHALFKGQHEDEYAWFSISASLPIVSMSAERAARQIVAALSSGRAARTLSLPAKLGALAHGLFPGLTADLLGLVNEWLPRSDASDRRARKGLHSTSERSPSWLTVLGERAARRNNQLG
jgi:NAD(P)-dependent dehydrogenase (short-subunit alcohol dehydrogenase family)